MTKHVVIQGAGKGGKTPKEAPDSIFSNNIAHILDLLGEGEIEGIVGATLEDKKKNIFYNEVPIIGPNGENNHNGVIIEANYGRPDQPALPGFDDVRTSVSVGQDLPFGVYKTISFPNDGSVTAVAVTIAGDNFLEVNKDGDTNGTSAQFVIERSQNGGSFEPVYNGDIRGKQIDEFTIDYRIPIIDTDGNTAIRVKRTKPDATSVKVSDLIKFKTYTKITEHKFSYPNLALVGHTIDAKQFGNQIPNRQYRVRGIKAKVPHNYDPVTRAYTGAFNGSLTATKVYTNNPAWIFYELLTNKRFGLGRFFNASLIDIPSIYQTGKWCDDPVSDGMGGFEPRWTCNTVITTRGEAFNVLKELVSCFRGSLFWMQAKLWAIGDQPREPVKIVTNANVVKGKFTYSGDSNRQRFSVINVTYNDPDLFFRRGIESVEDPNLIREIGYKTKDFGAFGCTSRAQARRLGKSILFSQEFESELVSYQASFDHMATSGEGPEGVAPGDLILVADKTRGNAVAGGRVVSVAGSAVTLDREAGVGVGTLYVEHQNGTIEWLTCTYNGDVVTLTEAATAPVATNDLFILVSNGFAAEPFVVLKVAREEANMIGISAVRYDEARYAAIYGDTVIDPKKYMSLPKTDVCQPVSLVNATDGYITGIDIYQRVINIDWTASPDGYLSHNIVSYSKDNDDWVSLPIASGNTAQIKDARAGTYRIRVAAVNRAGVYSNPVYVTLGIDTVPDDLVLATGAISGVAVQGGGGSSFGGRHLKIEWSVETPQSDYMDQSGISVTNAVEGIADPMFRDCIITVRRSNGTVLRTESVIDTNYIYTYEKNYEDTGGSPVRNLIIGVQYRDRYGRLSAETQTTVSNPAPTFTVQPVATAGLDAINVKVVHPVDTDYVGVKVYASLAANVALTEQNLVYTGTASDFILKQLGAALHYIKVVPQDTFGAGTPSNEITASPIGVAVPLSDILTDVSDLQATYGNTASSAANLAAAQAVLIETETAKVLAEAAVVEADAASTLAAGDAAIAEAAKSAAQISESNASGSASVATGQAANAAGSASAAATSQTLSAAYANTKGSLLPNGDFEAGAALWTGSNLAWYDHASYDGVWSHGSALSGTLDGPTIKIDPTRRFRAVVKWIQHQADTVNYAGFRCYNEAGGYLGNVYFDSMTGQTYNFGQFYVREQVYQGINPALPNPTFTSGGQFPPNTAAISPLILSNYTADRGIAVIDWQSFELFDVTESNTATIQAGISTTQAVAASQSASSAATSQTLTAGFETAARAVYDASHPPTQSPTDRAAYVYDPVPPSAYSGPSPDWPQPYIVNFLSPEFSGRQVTQAHKARIKKQVGRRIRATVWVWSYNSNINFYLKFYGYSYETGYAGLVDLGLDAIAPDANWIITPTTPYFAKLSIEYTMKNTDPAFINPVVVINEPAAVPNASYDGSNTGLHTTGIIIEDITESAAAASSATISSNQATIATAGGSTATTQAGLSATYALGGLQSAIDTFPSTFTAEGKYFTNTSTWYTPASSAPDHTGSFPIIEGKGKVLEATGGGRLELYTKASVKLVAGKTHQMRAESRVTVNGTNGSSQPGTRCYLGWQVRNSAGNTLGGYYISVPYKTVADGWFVHGGSATTEQIWATYPTAAYIQPFALANYNDDVGYNGGTMQFAFFEYKDVTEAASASSSATIATDQATIATGAGSTATTQASLSSSFATTAQSAAQQAHPTTFENQGTFFAGDNGVLGGNYNNLYFVNDVTYGPTARNNTPNGGYGVIAWKGRKANDVTKKWKVRALVRALTAETAHMQLRVEYYSKPIADGTARVTYATVDTPVISSSTPVWVEGIVDSAAYNAPFASPAVVLWGSSVTAGAIQEILALEMIDVTSEVASAASATVSSNSATTATGAASTATTQANLSATFANQAGNSLAATFPRTMSKAAFTGTNYSMFAPPEYEDALSPDGIYIDIVAGTSTYGYGVWCRKVLPVPTGRTIKLKTRVTYASGAGDSYVFVYEIYFNSAGTLIGGSYDASAALSGGNALDLTLNTLSSFPAGTAFVRYGILANRDVSTNIKPVGEAVKVAYLYLEDVTESVSAASSASAASTSATSASSSASTATTQANLSASFASAAKAGAIETYPSDFSQDGKFFTQFYGTDDGAANIDQVYSSIAYVDTANGRVARYGANSAQGSYPHTNIRKRVPIGPNVGRWFRLTAKARLHVSPGPSVYFVNAIYGLTANRATLTYGGFNTESVVYPTGAGAGYLPNDGSILTIVQEIKLSVPFADVNGNTPAYIHPGMYFVADGGGDIGQCDLIQLKFEDITSEKASQASASAASTSAANANASASSATASTNLIASFSLSQYLNRNPNFNDWPDGQTLPTKYALASGQVPVRVTGKLGRYAVQQSVVSGQPDCFLATSGTTAFEGTTTGYDPALGLLSAGWYVYTCEFTLDAGDLIGAGMYVALYNVNIVAVYSNSWSFVSVADVNGAVHGAGVVGRTYKYSFLFNSGSTETLIARLHPMTGWSGFGGVNLKTITWHDFGFRRATAIEVRDQTVLAPLEASVAVNSGAIATLKGETTAYWQVEGNAASGASFFISARARSAYGNAPDSNVSFGAREVHIYNPSGSDWKKALSVIGGNVILTGGLQAGAFIRLGSGAGWPVALKAQNFTISDGTVVSFGTDLGALPGLDFSTIGLAALTSGETYQLYADSFTSTGFTARLKISTPGTSTPYSVNTDSAPGSGPTRQSVIGGNPEAASGVYTYNWAYTFKARDYGYGEPGEGGEVFTNLHVMKAGVWSLVTTVSQYVQTSGFPSPTLQYADGSMSVNLGSGVQAWGISSGGYNGDVTQMTVTQINSINWVNTSVSGTRTATPASQTTTVTVRPS